MTVRDDLRLIVGGLWPYTDEGWQDVAVDRILVYLGRLDPDCDPELVAAHLKADRIEIARLKAAQDDLETAWRSLVDAAVNHIAKQNARLAELEADNLALIDLLGDTDD